MTTKASRPAAPLPLALAGAVAGLEAAAYLINGLVEWAATDSDRPVVGLSTGLFFVAFGAFLGLCAWRLWRLHVWTRAPIVMTQLIQLPVAVSFWGGSTRWVSVLLVVLSVVTIAGIFHPASLAALEDGD